MAAASRQTHSSEVSSPPRITSPYFCHPKQDHELQTKCNNLFLSFTLWQGLKERAAMVSHFSKVDGVLEIFNQHHIAKIHACFRNCFVQKRVPKAEQLLIRNVVQGLYEIALSQPEMLAQIDQVKENLPMIEEIVSNPDFAAELVMHISEAQNLIERHAVTPNSAGQIREMIRKLKPYTQMRQMLEFNQSNRMIHLACLLAKNPDMPQYVGVDLRITEVSKKIEEYQESLVDVQALRKKLLELIQSCKIPSSNAERLYDQYLSEFCEANKLTIWMLLFEFKKTREIFNVLLRIPLAAQADIDTIDLTVYSQFLEEFSPEFDEDKWIIHILSKVGPEELASLKEALENTVDEEERIALCCKTLKANTTNLLEIREVCKKEHRL